MVRERQRERESEQERVNRFSFLQTLYSDSVESVMYYR